MDYSKMLFAAAVHNLAHVMRQHAHPVGFEDDAPPEDYKDWEAEHPLSDFVPEALAAFKAVARQIDRLEAEQ